MQESAPNVFKIRRRSKDRMDINEILEDGIRRKIDFLGRAWYMVSISLSGKENDPFNYAVHIDTKADVFYQGKWYTGTDEMADELGAEYDDKIQKILETGSEIRLTRIYYDSDCCLHLYFDNTLEIHSRALSKADYSEEKKDYMVWLVFYEHKAAENWVVCYPGRVVLEENEYKSQELLDLDEKMWKLRRGRPRRIITGKEAVEFLKKHEGRTIICVDAEDNSIKLDKSADFPYYTFIFLYAECRIEKKGKKYSFPELVDRWMGNDEKMKEKISVKSLATDDQNNIHVLTSDGISICSDLKDEYDSWTVMTYWAVTEDITGKAHEIVAEKYAVSQEELDQLGAQSDALMEKEKTL